MKSASIAAIFAAIGSAAAAPSPTSDDVVFQITGFSASKPSRSGVSSYGPFLVSAPSFYPEPAQCNATVPVFSGSTTMPPVTFGVDYSVCDNENISWQFLDISTEEANTTTLTIKVDDVLGHYTIPQSEMTRWERDPEDPFDTVLSYVGPDDFSITDVE